MAELLSRIPGLDRVEVRPHGDGRFVRATLSVRAHDLNDAVESAAADLRSCALAAGVGPLVLVSARYSAV